MSDDLANFRLVTLQLSMATEKGLAQSISQHWGVFGTDEEALGAAVAKLPDLKPGFSVDQWLITSPFVSAPPADTLEQGRIRHG